ncbi:MAG: hypothetical protein V3V41_07920 [Candidatus Heimdallarchaeota archaeon]
MLFRACIELTKIKSNGDVLTKAQIEGFSGLVSFKFYGTPERHKGTEKTFLQMEFNIPDTSDIGDIKDQIDAFTPTYCFRVECPTLEFNCPAFRPE